MSDLYKHAERILYTHAGRLTRWHQALLELHDLETRGDVHAQTYGDTHASEGHVADPAAALVDRRLNLESRIARMERLVRIVEGIKTDYETSTNTNDGVKRTVLTSYYIDHVSMVDLAQHMNINYRTLYRRRREVVHDVIDRLERKTHDE